MGIPLVLRWIRERDRRGIVVGILSGGAGKIAGIATNVVAMPLAFSRLGEERFGIFLMLMGLAQWVGLGNFGMHNSIARFIADRGAGRRRILLLLKVATLLAGGFGGLLVLICTAAITLWYTTRAGSLGVARAEVVSSAALLLGLVWMRTVISMASGVLIGRLQLYLVNWYQLIGQLTAFSLLVVVSFCWHHVAGFVLALVGGPLIGDVLSALRVRRENGTEHFAWRQLRPWMPRLLSTGFSFTIINFAASACSGFLVFWVGAQTHPEDAAHFGLMMRVHGMMIGILTTLNNPLWPAMLDANRTRDRKWLRRVIISYLLLVWAIAVSVGGLVAVFGDDLLRFWVGNDFGTGNVYRAMWGAMLGQAALIYFWDVVLIGLKKERLVATTHLLRIAILGAFGASLIPQYGGIGAMAALAIAYFLSETFTLPIASWRAFAASVR
ncbi:MAG: hypothetical protein KatS3mg119_1952 [Rhodothalassiaceae bacterium]|nr:MAG: hypothetical protein KatS3mg119_1952 [Rhodothalassiaceae bacterium]